MITVSIFINGKPIYTRSACNITHKSPRLTSGKDMYEVDDGRVLSHHRDDGAVKLAIMLLKGVLEPG